MISIHKALREITEVGEVDLLLACLCDFTDPRMAKLVNYKWNGNLGLLIQHLLAEDLVTRRAVGQLLRIGALVHALVEDQRRLYGPDLGTLMADSMNNPN